MRSEMAEEVANPLVRELEMQPQRLATGSDASRPLSARQFYNAVNEGVDSDDDDDIDDGAGQEMMTEIRQSMAAGSKLDGDLLIDLTTSASAVRQNKDKKRIRK